MLPSIRPLMQRWSCGPVWEFADRNQIINACSRHDEYIWFFRPRLADCCSIPSFDRLHLRRPQIRQAHALADPPLRMSLFKIDHSQNRPLRFSELAIEGRNQPATRCAAIGHQRNPYEMVSERGIIPIDCVSGQQAKILTARPVRKLLTDCRADVD